MGLGRWALCGALAMGMMACTGGGGGSDPQLDGGPTDRGPDAQLSDLGVDASPDQGGARPLPSLDGEAGEVVWAVGLHSSGVDWVRARIALPTGGMAVLMQVDSPLTVQGRAGRTTLEPASRQAGLLLRFDRWGRLVWTRSLNGSAGQNTFVSWAFLVDDTLVVEGTGTVFCDGRDGRVDGDAWQCVYDLTGQLVEARAVPRLQPESGERDAITGTWLVRQPTGEPLEYRRVVVPSSRTTSARALAADDGGALVAMPFFEATTFGAGTAAERTLAPTVERSNRADLALGRYSADGTLQWVRQFTGWDSFDVHAMTRMPDGDWVVAIAARADSDDLRVERAPDDWLDVGGRPLTVMVCRYSDAGELRWLTPITAKPALSFGTWVHDLAPRADGGLTLSGAFLQGVAIGGDWETAPFQFERGERRWVYLADLDAEGQVTWAAEVGVVDNRNSEESLRLTPNPEGRLLVSGRIAGDTHGLSFEPAEEDDFMAWIGHVSRGGPLSSAPRDLTAALGEACETAGAPGCAAGLCDAAAVCVECTQDVHCGPERRCASQACVDGARGTGTAGFAEPCETDEAPVGCAEGLICVPERNLCAECVDDGDCEGTCFGGRCR